MKLFKFTTKVADGIQRPTASEFVDWYDGETEAEAREVYNEDLHRYGLPIDKCTTTVVECDRETLKPINK